MAKKNSLILIVLMAFTAVPVGFAEVIYVDANSPNDPGTGTASDPFRRIQDAINNDDTGSGDIIQIQPGVYTGYGNRDIDPGGLEITICGQDPNNPDIIKEIIIDCEGTLLDPHCGFYIHSGEGQNLVISGLTIRNAYSGDYGGAINCEYSSPTIKNCIIANNKAYYGGGIGYYQSDSAMLSNCTLVRNSSIFSGGGLFLDESHVAIKNSIFWDNYLDDPQNNYGPQMRLEYNSDVSISYTDLQGYQNGISTIGSTVHWLSGNTSDDPNFVSFSSEAKADTWDFHLQSEFGRWDANSQQWVTDLVTSPCIDAGDPNSNYASESWPHGARVNMGAYGGTSQASMNGNRADFNIDGAVNLVDFA